MKASFPALHQNARNYSGEKETVNTVRVVSRFLNKPEMGLRVICEARFYMARRSDGASPVYCSLWVHGAVYCSGAGKASGYGYHKESAALQAAIESAGIRLTGDNYTRKIEDEKDIRSARIDGCGSRAMEEAMQAIAIAAGADPELMLCE
jgi:hypothetical protein